jgi:iron complex transport system permease protein
VIFSLRRSRLVIAILSFALIAAAFLALLTGSVRFSPSDIRAAVQFLCTGSGNELAAAILFQIRLPRIVLALAIGASLAVAGSAFQAIFRNALADPFIIGTSSGAALGAGIAMLLPLSFAPLSLAAFAGSFGALLLALAISRASSGAFNSPPAATLLLAGTSISSLFSSLLSFLLIIKDGNLQRVYYWLLGSLSAATWTTLPLLLALMALGCALIAFFSRALDLLLQGDETAESLGLDVSRVRTLIILGAALAVAATVSTAGIIGFVGLAAPHAARLFVGPVHRRLLPTAALTGALLTLTADILARSIAPPLEIPIGIITALAGAPFFLYLLIRSSTRQARGW